MLGWKHTVMNKCYHVQMLHEPSCCNWLLGFKTKTPQKAHSYWKGSKHILIVHIKEKMKCFIGFLEK